MLNLSCLVYTDYRRDPFTVLFYLHVMRISRVILIVSALETHLRTFNILNLYLHVESIDSFRSIQ